MGGRIREAVRGHSRADWLAGWRAGPRRSSCPLAPPLPSLLSHSSQPSLAGHFVCVPQCIAAAAAAREGGGNGERE